MSDALNNPPVRVFSAGVLSVAIFVHAGKAPEHRPWYSVSPQRSFKRDGAADWERCNQYNRDDLPVIAELMSSAFRWIIAAEDKTRQEAKAAR